jgi:dienelactone hydrolase
MNNDPLIAHETQPTQTMAAMVRADERLKKEFSQITLPVLILHGTLDRNTKPSGSQHFYDMAASADKTLKLYEGGFHDLLNDLDKELVILDIKNWINGHLPAAAALLEARMSYASDRGYELAMMGTEASSQSQRNAERKDFRIAYTRTKWRLYRF